MAERRAPRHDPYGRPLPTLADVREQSLLDSGANLEARRVVQGLLEDTYRQYLKRGVYAQIEIGFHADRLSIWASHFGRQNKGLRRISPMP